MHVWEAEFQLWNGLESLALKDHCSIFGKMICIRATSFGGPGGSSLPEGELKYLSASSRSWPDVRHFFHRKEPVASQEYATVPSKAPLERLTLLHRAASFLCSEKTGDWSFASLSSALDIPKEELQKEFSTEEALLEATREMLPEVLLAALSKPLRTARTGREAVHGMLEIAISLRRGYRRLKDHRAGVRSLAVERQPDAEVITNCGNCLEHQIKDRLERSVDEGELPESANILSISALTLTVVNGLLISPVENGSAATLTLLDSVKLFVDGLGFHVVRPVKRRQRRLAPVLQFVRRSSCDPLRN